jgi:hypothetical protein
MNESQPVAEVKLDEKRFSEKRRRQSSIRRAEEWYGGLVKGMYKKYGFEGTQCNNDQMMEMAWKYVPRALKNFHIVGNDCRTVAAYFKMVDKIVFDADFEVLLDTPRRVVMRGATGCPLSSHPQDELCQEICEGGMGHEVIACQIINPELTFKNLKLMSAGDDSCDLCFELPESAKISPESVPVSLYKLDETAWPLERREKARQQRDWENYGSMVRAIFKKYGKEGMEVVQEVTSDSAKNYVIMSLQNFHLKGNDARTAGGYYKDFHKLIFDNDLEIVEDSPKRVVLRNNGFCPLSQKIGEELTPDICLSSMGHEHKACELINPQLRFSVPRLRSAGDPYCEYVFELKE